MTILLKAIYRFNAITIKIPTQFFIRLERSILKFIWNNKETSIAKNNLNKKLTSLGISAPELKQCYRAIMIITAWYWWQAGRSMELN